jgi:hypothetical protein
MPVSSRHRTWAQRRIGHRYDVILSEAKDLLMGLFEVNVTVANPLPLGFAVGPLEERLLPRRVLAP